MHENDEEGEIPGFYYSSPHLPIITNNQVSMRNRGHSKIRVNYAVRLLIDNFVSYSMFELLSYKLSSVCIIQFYGNDQVQVH